ncbi:transmembrane protein, putative, partial [Bodo saltans]
GVQPNSNSGYHSSNNGGTGSNSAYHSSNDGGTGSHSMLPKYSNTGKKQQRTFKQQSLIPFLSQGTMQCPFFDNHCHVDGVRLTIDGSEVRTNDLVRIAGCDSLGVIGNDIKSRFYCHVDGVRLTIDGYDVRTNDLVRIAGCDSLGVIGNDIKSRFWAVTAAAMSAMTFLIAICHARKGNNFGNYAGLIKFGAAGIAAAHVGACGAVFLLEAPISSCVVNYLTSVYDELNGTYLIVMLSLMFNYAAAGLNFLNALGMMLSYCVSCCGAPAGRDTRPASSVSSLTYIGIPLMSPFQAQQSYDTYGRLEGGNIQEGAEGAAVPTKEV